MMELPLAELDRQLALLRDTKLVPARELAVTNLRDALVRAASKLPAPSGTIPVCIAMRRPPVASLMERITVLGVPGGVDMTPCEPGEFAPIDGVRVPDDDVYVLVDVDTGRSRLGVTPEESLAAIRSQGRTPLTLEEGVMLAFLFPILADKERYNAIQMPGSRSPGEQRVPSLWVSKGAPRLGWCWDRNLHTWLASASAAARLSGAAISQR